MKSMSPIPHIERLNRKKKHELLWRSLKAIRDNLPNIKLTNSSFIFNWIHSLIIIGLLHIDYYSNY